MQATRLSETDAARAVRNAVHTDVDLSAHHVEWGFGLDVDTLYGTATWHQLSRGERTLLNLAWTLYRGTGSIRMEDLAMLDDQVRETALLSLVGRLIGLPPGVTL